MEICANILQDVEDQKNQIAKQGEQITQQGELITKQGEIIKSQGEVIENQKVLLNKQGADLLNVQKVVFLQDKEIEALKGAVGKLIQERMHFVMQMRPPSHVATTKGEVTKPVSDANV